MDDIAGPTPPTPARSPELSRELTPDPLVEPVSKAPAVGPLGGRQQVSRQAGRGHLELEPDDPTIGPGEVERDGARELVVMLEEQCWAEQLVGS
jgi:hypothetical protein